MVEKANDLTPPIKFKKPKELIPDRTYTWNFRTEYWDGQSWVLRKKGVSQIAAVALYEVMCDPKRFEAVQVRYKKQVIALWDREHGELIGRWPV